MKTTKRLRYGLMVGATVLSLGVMSACGSANDSSQAGKSESSKSDSKTLTIYNGQHEQTTEKLVKAFEEKTGIKVKVRNGGSSELANQIAEEGKNSPADVFYSEESTPLAMLADKGMLEKVDSNTLKQVPKQYSDKNGDWIGVTARTRVAVYNTDMISEKELPKSVLDFAKPEWKGKVGYVPTSGAFQEQVVAIAKTKGDDVAKKWLEGLKKYGKKYNNNGAALDAVRRGQVETALINNYYWFREASELGKDKMHSKLYYFKNQDPGGLITISGAGELKSAKHKKEADEFLKFITSKEGQEVLAKNSEEYPLHPGVTSKYDLKPLNELEPPHLSPSDLGDGQKALKLLQEVGLN
ncbi:iron(III) transport system substrate-binding protein [Scopulibacillus daqui]|uniref:Iron(III) transport system substrate-binding protein n=1 Tax=Scopulibacillus daqui TaxID=1469162 RepID=A0ABS2Q1E7_9BACL|nr:iron ABC transporter substrate-binding protein [Scopulibacillus daqui]MBM7646126.1 iron(III) transport system substrate-binding protein [Scopulibacillus daqui]